ncbi:MAG TPA: ABC transporter ATP-binding protein [Stellaceae bacterium]|jgi:branched-chain amino acid transport system ATP-binding protein|nr:ABC transporter ATP-binding protein [Stellaceae bacterium]
MSDLLRIENVTAGYAGNVVLEQVSLSLAANSSIALLGRNGVGKTTLLATIMGLTRIQAGQVMFDGTDLAAVQTHQRAELGIGYVPQEREIFQSLTVHENLKVAVRAGDWTVDRIYELFTSLKDRRGNFGNQLSGGEQQMLAVGRALVSNPKMLLLDEPFEGLAPVIVDQLVDGLDHIRKSSKLAMILVEHHAEIALEFAESALVLDRGQVTWHGSAAELRDNPEKLGTLIGLEEEARR